MEKGEIAQNEQFHLFPQCFLKSFFLQCVKMSIYGAIMVQNFLPQPRQYFTLAQIESINLQILMKYQMRFKSLDLFPKVCKAL